MVDTPKHTLVVLVDDPVHAEARLRTLTALPHDTDWILVGCAPRMTHRIGKWASNSSREHLRREWSHRVFDHLRRVLADVPHDRLQVMLAKGPLPGVVVELQQRCGGDVTVLDARRPKAADAQPSSVVPSARWMSALLMSLCLGLTAALVD